MKTTTPPLTAAPLALAATLLAAFLILFSPLSASAHDSLVASSPAADSEVETLPDELTLTFSAKLIDGEGATEVVVTDPNGDQVSEGPATVEGAIVTQPLTGSGPAGEYRVIWKVVSSDGHPTSDEFSFSVTTASDAVPTAQPSAAPTTSAPSAETETTPEASASATPTADESDGADATTWIWVLSIVGVLIIVGLAVWLILRRPRSNSTPGSAPPTER
ncbi:MULTISPECIES: copper resistance CopC family protein [unclassified Microbacterium]|uniref:copper resistance CopC family protein n=1 Tax=unclassified Microbacterium TaxID=2609290 RepID=UPI000EA95967|nr:MULTISPECIES: copper resistance CopC family protein [unclassified Microbacterium]MBT2486363.1 copper resistance protein CopC [Microbacterium sp. ISL-108]RKN69071.1 copper resistance protein CopC [Microbacterium sp. CGR2]